MTSLMPCRRKKAMTVFKILVKILGAGARPKAMQLNSKTRSFQRNRKNLWCDFLTATVKYASFRSTFAPDQDNRNNTVSVFFILFSANKCKKVIIQLKRHNKG
jgi:hypothetical protein